MVVDTRFSNAELIGNIGIAEGIESTSLRQRLRAVQNLIFC